MLLLLMAGVYAFHQRKKADQATELMNPFGKQNPTLHLFCFELLGITHHSLVQMQHHGTKIKPTEPLPR
jgi:hypothetical protein